MSLEKRKAEVVNVKPSQAVKDGSMSSRQGLELGTHSATQPQPKVQKNKNKKIFLQILQIIDTFTDLSFQSVIQIDMIQDLEFDNECQPG